MKMLYVEMQLSFETEAKTKAPYEEPTLRLAQLMDTDASHNEPGCIKNLPYYFTIQPGAA
jgi:hypothetical protein